MILCHVHHFYILSSRYVYLSKIQNVNKIVLEDQNCFVLFVLALFLYFYLIYSAHRCNINYNLYIHIYHKHHPLERITWFQRLLYFVLLDKCLVFCWSWTFEQVIS